MANTNRCWLTVHWPEAKDPTQKDDLVPQPSGVSVRDGKRAAAHGMEPGDLVAIYETAKGPLWVEDHREGKVVRPGRAGVVCIVRITRMRPADPWTYVYTNGKRLRWDQVAETANEIPGPTVPRSTVNRILGLSPNYYFRGWGRMHSGLSEISRDQLDAIRAELEEGSAAEKRRVKDETHHHETSRRGGHHSGGCGESDEHKELKKLIYSDPCGVLGIRDLVPVQEEYPFASGDTVDVLLKHRLTGVYVAVEVEVQVNDQDWVVPIQQAVKYRALADVEFKAAKGASVSVMAARHISPAAQRQAEKYCVRGVVVKG